MLIRLADDFLISYCMRWPSGTLSRTAGCAGNCPETLWSAKKLAASAFRYDYRDARYQFCPKAEISLQRMVVLRKFRFPLVELACASCSRSIFSCLRARFG